MLDLSYIPILLTTTQEIEFEYFQDSGRSDDMKALLLINLVNMGIACFPEALAAAKGIEDKCYRTMALTSLAMLDISYLPEVLAEVREVEDDYNHQDTLRYFAILDGVKLTQITGFINFVFDRESRFKNSSNQKILASNLTNIDVGNLQEEFEKIREINDKHHWIESLTSLAKIDVTYFPEALAEALTIKDNQRRENIFISLVEINVTYFPEEIVAKLIIECERFPTKVLID
jgi:hypothetical protein